MKETIELIKRGLTCHWARVKPDSQPKISCIRTKGSLKLLDGLAKDLDAVFCKAGLNDGMVLRWLGNTSHSNIAIANLCVTRGRQSVDCEQLNLAK